MILMRNGFQTKQDIHVTAYSNKGWMFLMLKEIINSKKALGMKLFQF